MGLLYRGFRAIIRTRVIRVIIGIIIPGQGLYVSLLQQRALELFMISAIHAFIQTFSYISREGEKESVYVC